MTATLPPLHNEARALFAPSKPSAAKTLLATPARSFSRELSERAPQKSVLAQPKADKRADDPVQASESQASKESERSSAAAKSDDRADAAHLTSENEVRTAETSGDESARPAGDGAKSAATSIAAEDQVAGTPVPPPLPVDAQQLTFATAQNAQPNQNQVRVDQTANAPQQDAVVPATVVSTEPGDNGLPSAIHVGEVPTAVESGKSAGQNGDAVQSPVTPGSTQSDRNDPVEPRTFEPRTAQVRDQAAPTIADPRQARAADAPSNHAGAGLSSDHAAIAAAVADRAPRPAVNAAESAQSVVAPPTDAINVTSSSQTETPTGNSGENRQDANAQTRTPRSGGNLAASGRAQSDILSMPAVGRAAQVAQVVTVEQLTGHAVTQSLDVSAPASFPSTNTVSLSTGTAPAAAGEIADPILNPPTGAQQETNVAGRIMRGLHAMVNQRGGVMTMRLQPAELGHLRIQMSIVQGVVTAQFTATSEHAQSILERNLTVLRTALEGHGLHVDKLGVQVQTADHSSNARHEENQHQQQSPHRHDASGGESRGRQQQRQSEHHSPESARLAPSDFAMNLDAFDLSLQESEAS